MERAAQRIEDQSWTQLRRAVLAYLEGGNLDTLATFYDVTPDDIIDETNRCIADRTFALGLK